jgi:uncharacterized delta-60 repeat protein
MDTKQTINTFTWLARCGLAVMLVLLTFGSTPVNASISDKQDRRTSGLVDQNPANQPPIAVGDSGSGFTTNSNKAFTTGNVLANDHDPDGKPLFVQSFGAGGAKGQVQYITPGSLDTGFGNGGTAKVTFDVVDMGPAWGNALLQQPDGKLVVVGEYIDWSVGTYFGLARFYPNGSLDASFGSGGKVGTTFNQHGAAFAAALQPDGKIIAAGDVNNVFAAVRYNPDGSLDSTFGSGGLVTTDFPGNNYDFAEAVVVQPDKKIILVGSSEYDDGHTDFALARYKPNGSLDTTFGNKGKVFTNFGSDSYYYASSAVLQADGKMVVVGDTDYGIMVVRFNTNGSLDNTFGTGGKAYSTNWSNGSTVTLQGDGKILIAGQYVGNIDVERFNTNGQPDSSFGANGAIKTDVGHCYGGSRGSVKVQADGKIIYAGTCGNNLTFTLARYNQDGSLDASFGTGGIAMPGLGGDSVAHGVVFQPDGKIVAAGEMGGGFCVARYNTDGAFRYNPNGQFDSLPLGQTADDTFTYVASDGVLTDTATVTITLEGATPVFLPVVAKP